MKPYKINKQTGKNRVENLSKTDVPVKPPKSLPVVNLEPKNIPKIITLRSGIEIEQQNDLASSVTSTSMSEKEISFENTIDSEKCTEVVTSESENETKLKKEKKIPPQVSPKPKSPSIKKTPPKPTVKDKSNYSEQTDKLVPLKELSDKNSSIEPDDQKNKIVDSPKRNIHPNIQKKKEIFEKFDNDSPKIKEPNNNKPEDVNLEKNSKKEDEKEAEVKNVEPSVKSQMIIMQKR